MNGVHQKVDSVIHKLLMDICHHSLWRSVEAFMMIERR